MSVALVTGASRGIGAACARALAVAGHDVVVNYRSGAEGAAAVVADIVALGRRAVALQADIADEAQAADLVARTEAQLGDVDVLVLNAGITRDGLAIRTAAAAWQEVIQTNLTGAFFTARPVFRGMLRRRGGSIVAVSSVVGMVGNPGQSNYAAAKAGLVGLVKSLALEGAGRGVRVNAVLPGIIRTEMTADVPTAQFAELVSRTPMGRLGTADDVAQAVAFLASPAAAFITGTTLVVDGGLTAA